VPGHRSPRGARAPRAAGTSGTGRHHAAHRPAPAGPSLGTTVIATTAAVGAVATGAFTALVPALQDGTTTSAAADAPFDTALAANSTGLDALTPAVSVLPVDLADDLESLQDDVARVAQAADLAKLHAEQAREQAERDRIAAMIERGGVDGWIAEALQILDLPQSLAPSVKRIIMKESGGDPRAINNWDSNARRGTPSQGLMQTIPTTYKHYVHPELKNRPITDPVANITAGVRYMLDNYGMKTLQAGGRTNSAGKYVGY
jgi:soluble lytic murein transglycosylase-like protein